MNLRHPLTALLLLASAFLFACGGKTRASNDKSFRVELNASSDDSVPLDGVRFATGTSTIGTTNAEGLVAVKMRGADGQSVPITAKCPEGYDSPETPTPLKLTSVRRVNEAQTAPLELNVTCVRRQREVVVVVRAPDAPSLAVDVAGKTVGKTDAEGNAHVRMLLARDVRSLSVTLATADAPALRPQNPSRVYELDGNDAILLLYQSFSKERKVVNRRRSIGKPSPSRHIPYKVDSNRFSGF
ncbi:MAG: hypothetical protein QM784_30485 [Polyangiaceae bacterium]